MQHRSFEGSTDDFRPVFIVGCERSGTTLLSVLLDRHPRLCITPETYFLFEKSRFERGAPANHTELVRRFFSFWRTPDLHLDEAALLGRFRVYPADSKHLLRAVLEEYGARHDYSRVGEKTPAHIVHVPLILQWFPQAKIICMLRDGRDVVLSLTRVDWAHNNLRLHCLKWRALAKLARTLENSYPNNFRIIRFEDMIQNARETIAKIDKFIGLDFNRAQLDSTIDTAVVPEREKGWKASAESTIDHHRVQQWQQHATAEQLCTMNSLLAKMLRSYGYASSTPNDCTVAFRLKNYAMNVPYVVCYSLLSGLLLKKKLNTNALRRIMQALRLN